MPEQLMRDFVGIGLHKLRTELYESGLGEFVLVAIPIDKDTTVVSSPTLNSVDKVTVIRRMFDVYSDFCMCNTEETDEDSR
jgi:hypothetical protein